MRHCLTLPHARIAVALVLALSLQTFAERSRSSRTRARRHTNIPQVLDKQPPPATVAAERPGANSAAQSDGGRVEVRLWTDIRGTTIEARFVTADASSVKIQKQDDGKIYTVPLARLSEDDRAYVAKLTGKAAKASSNAPRAAARSARPPADTARVTIPANLRKQADKAFAAGKRIFIWLPKEGPFNCGGGGTFRVLTIPVNFVAKDGRGEKFNVAMTLEIKDSGTGEVDTIQQTKMWHKDNKVSARGTTDAMYAVVDSYLSGKGTADINLTSHKQEDKVISNTIIVDVGF